MTLRAPSLSIVIPTLNEADRLPKLLKQLSSARDRGAEIVVVDGGSNDGTARIAQEGGVHVVSSPRGRATQLQAGVDASSGDALWLLHADSDIDPMSDQHVVWALADSLRPWGRFSARLEGRHPMLHLIARMMNLRSRLTGVATGDQGLFMRREILERIGGIPQQPLMEDVELCKRLRDHCPPICLGKRVTSSGRRWLHHGVWRTILLMWRLRYDYWRGADAAELAARYRVSDQPGSASPA